MSTNYEKVLLEFNKSFGVKTIDTPTLDIFDKDPKLVEYRLSLIEEEFNELKDAISKKDFVEVVDALTDILYVTYGFYTAIGVDGDKAYKLVHESNMSKLCKTEEEAIKTVEFYKNDGRYDSPAYRLSPDGKYYVVYNQSTTKILKSIYYKPVSFNTIL
jgi:predicted HAD superfamily Cof-like phosphohydrolase